MEEQNSKRSKIAVCICSLDTVLFEWVLRTFNPMAYENQVDFDKVIKIWRGAISIGQKRDALITEALTDPTITHVLFLDNDVIVEGQNPNNALRFLLALNVPIVSGLIRTKKINFEYMIYEEKGGKYTAIKNWDKKSDLLQVDGVGAGFLLIKREVFEHLKKPWFQVTTSEYITTEDIEFCERVKKDGYYKVYVFLPIALAHMGILKVNSNGKITTIEDTNYITGKVEE